MSQSKQTNCKPEDPELAVKIGKDQNPELPSQYEEDLRKWHENVDKGYAWVILGSLSLTLMVVFGPNKLYGLVFSKVTELGIYTREEASWPVSTIFTVENLIGPLISIVTYYISSRQSMFIGVTSVVLCNLLSGLIDSLILDVIFIGFGQGIGYAFILVPFMSIINSYFLKYRNIAIGLALSGGTLSVFILMPIFEWTLEAFYWRRTYLGFAACCAISIVIVPLFRENPKPDPPKAANSNADNNDDTISTTGSFAARALSYQSSFRRQSSLPISRLSERQPSVISVNPTARSVGMERKISRAIATGAQKQDNTICVKMDEILDEVEPKSGEFSMAIVCKVLKTPAFHMIWYNELLYFWFYTIWCLVIVDYGEDRGCTKEEAESLIGYQSVGELIGRLGLTVLVDLKLLSNKDTMVLVLFIVAAILVTVTQVVGYMWLVAISMSVAAFSSLLWILLNGLLVDYLGEKQVTIGYGMASCIGGALMAFRPQAVGYSRDYLGSYDPLMLCMAGFFALGGLLWMVEPLITRCVRGRKGSTSSDL